MTHGDYPRTVLEVLDDAMEFPPAVLEAVSVFKRSGPWTGSIRERIEKFERANIALARACGIRPPDLVIGGLTGASSGGSVYEPLLHAIVLTGRLSVVTYLHEFAHACGMGERAACCWSINLFRLTFPRQFARLVHQGHMLIRPEDL